VFNALNHVNYGNPSTTITNTSFGLIQASGSMRPMQGKGENNLVVE